MSDYTPEEDALRTQGYALLAEAHRLWMARYVKRTNDQSKPRDCGQASESA